MIPRALSALEARVLAVLVEKAHTVPDSYPLSLNALMAGCNQKTARDPVMSASDADVQAAVDELRRLSLVFESSGSRVSRYEHNMGRAIGVPSQSVALLATLMLRGPQTASELRTNAERLHRFADLSSVEGFLDELAERAQDKGGPLVVKLPRAPGTRESRWAHLLTGEVDVSSLAAHEPRAAAPESSAGLREEVRALSEEVARLKAQVQRMSRELGIELSDDGFAAGSD